MKYAPAFQFYPQDFLVGTAYMSAAAVGGYARLLCYQWEHGSIPCADDILIALTGCRIDEITEIRLKFSASKKDGKLRNKRLEKERKKQREFRSSQSKKAANAWKQRRKVDGSAYGSAMPEGMPKPCSSSSSSPSGISTHKGGGIPKDEEQAIEWASMEAVPAEFASEVYHQLVGRNWIDGAGQDVSAWRNHIRYRWIKRRGEKNEPSSEPGKHIRQRQLTPLDLKTIRDTKEALSAQLRERYAADGPMGTTWSDDAKWQEWKTLRTEINQINRQLSGFA